MLVIVGDVALDLLCQILYGGKVPSVEDVLVEYTEPDFNRVQPATVDAACRRSGYDARDHSGRLVWSACAFGCPICLFRLIPDRSLELWRSSAPTTRSYGC
jgi:hypothetical protein